MKVLLVHNRYQQRGGEDAVVETERALLEAAGLDVEIFLANNDHIRSAASKLKACTTVFHNPIAISKLNVHLSRFRPDVVHVHNWFPTLSPGMFRMCKRHGVAVVHTLHNYRLLCIKASLFRDGKPCDDCLGKAFRLPGIAHRCYRDSFAGSVAATSAMVAHWKLKTWESCIDRYIALSEFARTKLIEGGLPPEKIAVKPNSLSSDPGFRAGDGGYLVYAGRLTDEKGVPILLDCWRNGPDLPPLRVVGSGPLESLVRSAAASLNNVEWIGPRSSGEVLDILGKARAVLCPSLWYEGMPRIAVESMAVGTPVIASRLGTYLEMIEHGQCGMLFEAGRADALLSCVREFASNAESAKMRVEARRQFELRYSGDTNLQTLLGIYHQVLAGAGVSGQSMEPVRAA